MLKFVGARIRIDVEPTDWLRATFVILRTARERFATFVILRTARERFATFVILRTARERFAKEDVVDHHVGMPRRRRNLLVTKPKHLRRYGEHAAQHPPYLEVRRERCLVELPLFSTTRSSK